MPAPTVALTDTTSGSLGGTSGAAGLIQKAYDRLVEFQLRSTPMIRTIADKRPSPGTLPGSTVALQIHNDIAAATSVLDELYDVSSVAISTPSIVNVSLNEYGNSVTTTKKLRTFSLSEVDPAVANIIAYNMANSIDALAMTEVMGGTNVVRPNNRATTGAVTSTDYLTAKDVRKAVAKLRANNAMGKKGNLFAAYVHPEVSADLRGEVGFGNGANWRDPSIYNKPENIWAGEIGSFEGAYFVESPRLTTATDGAASAKVYRSIIAGQQALAEAVAIEPHVVIGPSVDRLQRFQPIGWYGVLGFKRYREEALYRLESASSYA